MKLARIAYTLSGFGVASYFLIACFTGHFNISVTIALWTIFILSSVGMLRATYTQHIKSKGDS